MWDALLPMLIKMRSNGTEGLITYVKMGMFLIVLASYYAWV